MFLEDLDVVWPNLQNKRTGHVWAAHVWAAPVTIACQRPSISIKPFLKPVSHPFVKPVPCLRLWDAFLLKICLHCFERSEPLGIHPVVTSSETGPGPLVVASLKKPHKHHKTSQQTNHRRDMKRWGPYCQAYRQTDHSAEQSAALPEPAWRQLQHCRFKMIQTHAKNPGHPWTMHGGITNWPMLVFDELIKDDRVFSLRLGHRIRGSSMFELVWSSKMRSVLFTPPRLMPLSTRFNHYRLVFYKMRMALVVRTRLDMKNCHHASMLCFLPSLHSYDNRLHFHLWIAPCQPPQDPNNRVPMKPKTL